MSYHYTIAIVIQVLPDVLLEKGFIITSNILSARVFDV